MTSLITLRLVGFGKFLIASTLWHQVKFLDQKLCPPDTELVSTKSDICWASTLILPHVVNSILWQCFPDVLQRFSQ